MKTEPNEMYFGMERCGTVHTEDGVQLVVSECGDPSSPITMVFLHGFTANMTTWQCQKRLLSRSLGDKVRMVFYDHRGHGMSGQSSYDSSTVDQLGRDLGSVISSVVPHGDIVLVGHSMGGMALMSYARQFPSMIGPRVKSVGLLSTSSGKLYRTGVPALLNGPLVDILHKVQSTTPYMSTAAVWAAHKLQSPVIQAIILGEKRRSTLQIAKFLENMFLHTDLSTIVNFLHALKIYDETCSLDVLRSIPSLVLYGEKDNLVNPAHSAFIASRLTNPTVCPVPGAGHMVMMERPRVVGDALTSLVRPLMNVTPRRSNPLRQVM